MEDNHSLMLWLEPCNICLTNYVNQCDPTADEILSYFQVATWAYRLLRKEKGGVQLPTVKMLTLKVVTGIL